MTSFGRFPRAASVSASSKSLATIETAPASRISRIVCCCGKISLPFGAAESIGTTNITKSFGSNKSPIILRSFSPFGANAAMRSFKTEIFSPVFALTKISFSPSCFCVKSALFFTMIYGMLLF